MWHKVTAFFGHVHSRLDSFIMALSFSRLKFAPENIFEEAFSRRVRRSRGFKVLTQWPHNIVEDAWCRMWQQQISGLASRHTLWYTGTRGMFDRLSGIGRPDLNTVSPGWCSNARQFHSPDSASIN